MEVDMKSCNQRSMGDTLAIGCEGLRERLRAVLGSYSNSEVSRITCFHPETVRRYRISGEMRASFITAVALRFDVNADWLLTGRGTPQVIHHHRDLLSENLRKLANELDEYASVNEATIDQQQAEVPR